MISLIHPSRGRSKKSYANTMDWISKSGCDVEVILTVDSSDNWREYFDIYPPYPADAKPPYVRMYMGDHKNLVEATNHAASKAKGDILVYLSDDFKCFPEWGIAVSKEFEGCTTPRILKIDDKLQDFHVRVLTMPIMNRAAYEQLGYFFNPLYKSMWVDCDLYEVAHRRGWLKPCKHLVFPHEHVSNGMAPDDETYRRSAANWDQGKAVFEERRRMRFV